MADRLTDVEEITTLLNTASGRIVVGDTPPSDSNDTNITRDGIERIRLNRESQILGRIGRWYVLPLALTDTNTRKRLTTVATQLSAYDVWVQVHPTMSIADLPAAVKEWKTMAMDTLEAIVPKGKEAPKDGRDEVLVGESLKTAAGDAGTAAVAFTSMLPVGGSTS